MEVFYVAYDAEGTDMVRSEFERATKAFMFSVVVTMPADSKPEDVRKTIIGKLA